MAYVLKFISGKYKDGEFPLDKKVIIIGRHSDSEMVLSENMISRRHARITMNGRDIILEDLGSTNGTFVNGSRIKKIKLKIADRILVGTSIAKLIEANAPARSMQEVNTSGTVNGLLEDIPIPEVLQLLATSKKTGVLKVEGFEVFLDKGVLQGAKGNGLVDKVALFQLLKLKKGEFDFSPVPIDNLVKNPLNLFFDAFLQEAAAKAKEEVAIIDDDFLIDDDDSVPAINDDLDDFSLGDLDDDFDLDDLDDDDDFSLDDLDDNDNDDFSLDDDKDDDDFSLDDLDDDKDNDFTLDDLDDDDDFSLDDLDDDKDDKDDFSLDDDDADDFSLDDVDDNKDTNFSLDDLDDDKDDDDFSLDDLDDDKDDDDFSLDDLDDDKDNDDFSLDDLDDDKDDDDFSLDDLDDNNKDDDFSLDDLDDNKDDDFSLDDLDDNKDDDFSLDDLDDNNKDDKDDDFGLDDLDDNQDEVSVTVSEVKYEISEEELNKIKEELPLDLMIVIPLPLFAPLVDLSKDELKLIQLVMNFGVVSDIIENSEFSDIKTYMILSKLLDEEYIEEE